jgi:MMP 1-O-methyltransferase
VNSRTEVQGWYTDDEGARLVELARSTPGPYVELGTAWGKSVAYVLDQTDKDAVCVDLWGDGEYKDKELYSGAYEYFTTLLYEEGWTDRVTILRMSTRQAARTWTQPIGLLHIDAGHDYEDVLADYLEWSPHIVPGGAIAFDDYGSYDGPRRVVDELVAPDPRWVDQRIVYVQWSARLEETWTTRS